MNAQTTQEALNLALRDLEAWKAAALAAQAERDAFAAQNKMLKDAGDICWHNWNASIDVFGAMQSLMKTVKSTPQQCLAEIRAESGRAGFLAGSGSPSSRAENDAIHRDADDYAESIRKGEV